MYTNLNPRTMGLNHHNFGSLLASAHKHGFRGIEVPAGAFETREKAASQAKRMHDLDMRFGLIMTPCDMYKVDDATFEDALATLGRWAELASIAGCTRAFNHIWPGNDTRDYEDNFDWHIRRISRVFRILNDNGIQYGLEYIGPKTVREQFKYPFIHSLSGILSLTDCVDKRIGFVFDTIHWYCTGSDLDDLYYAAMHTDRIVNVHLCDATAAPHQQIDNMRAMPLETGLIDSSPILRLFDKHGYDGPVIMEPMNPTMKRYAEMKLDDAVQEAMTCLNTVFRQAGIESK